MRGYTATDVAKMLDLSVGQIRYYAREGFLEPRRGRRGEYRFSFQDLVLLRTAKGLIAARIPPRKIKRALKKLKEQLPSGRPLSALQIAADGDRIVVRDGRTIWSPESGQISFDFEVAELAERVAPLARKAAKAATQQNGELGAEDWFELGCELETADPESARDAYRRVLELDPSHAEAHVNLGRLLHESDHLGPAEAHYRLALAVRPRDPTAAFNLGVSMEDQGRYEEAIGYYRISIESERPCADAHYNLARIYQRLGNEAAALRHMTLYRKLTSL